MGRKPTASEIDLLQSRFCVCFGLRKANRAVTQFFDEAYRPIGLLSTQVSLLFIIRALGSATINRLAEIMVIDRTTLSRNLRPLESRGLIEILTGKDRRTRRIFLTDKGLTRAEAAVPLWHKAQSHFLAALGEDPLRRLLSDLDLAIDAVGFEPESVSAAARQASKSGKP